MHFTTIATLVTALSALSTALPLGLNATQLPTNTTDLHVNLSNDFRASQHIRLPRDKHTPAVNCKGGFFCKSVPHTVNNYFPFWRSMIGLDTGAGPHPHGLFLPNPAIDILATYVATGMDDTRHFYDGEHIACFMQFCAFAQHTRGGLYGRQIRALMEVLHGKCSVCGSVALDLPGVVEGKGELTVNYVYWHNACEGLCYRQDSNPNSTGFVQYIDGNYSMPFN